VSQSPFLLCRLTIATSFPFASTCRLSSNPTPVAPQLLCLCRRRPLRPRRPHRLPRPRRRPARLPQALQTNSFLPRFDARASRCRIENVLCDYVNCKIWFSFGFRHFRDTLSFKLPRRQSRRLYVLVQPNPSESCNRIVPVPKPCFHRLRAEGF